MPTSKISPKSRAIAKVDIGPWLPESVEWTPAFRRRWAELRRSLEICGQSTQRVLVRMVAEGEPDKLGNFEIRDIMSEFNALEASLAAALSKRDEVASTLLAESRRRFVIGTEPARRRAKASRTAR